MAEQLLDEYDLEQTEEVEFLAQPGSGITDEDAGEIAQELLGIYREHGTLPDNWALVEIVKGNPKSALRKHIDWDIDKAARVQWATRISNLRRAILVRSVSIDKPVRYFVQYRVPVEVEELDEEEGTVLMWAPRPTAISQAEALNDLVRRVIKRMYGYRNELADLLAAHGEDELKTAQSKRLRRLVDLLDKLV